MRRGILALAISGVIMWAGPTVAQDEPRKVMIAPGLYSFVVDHQGDMVEIKRAQNPDSQVHRLYSGTARGMPQPIAPFRPHPVDTIAEREFASYMMKAQRDDSIMIVDTRTEGWHARLTIPGAENMPYTLMDDPVSRQETLEEFGAEQQDDGSYDFSSAATLVMFCNGYWCAQTPTMVRALLAQNYPPEKIKYYRGGMQAWTSLGFTVVGDAAN